MNTFNKDNKSFVESACDYNQMKNTTKFDV